MKLSRLAYAVVVAASLTGCAAGFNAPTQVQKPVTNGINLTVGGIAIRDALLVIDSSAPVNASFVATLINSGDATDQLVSVSSTVDVTAAKFAPIDLESKAPVQLSQREGQPLVAFTSEAGLVAGRFVTVTLNFAKAEPIRISVPVYSKSGNFKDVIIPVVKDGKLPSYVEPSSAPSDAPTPSPSAS